MGGCTLQGEHRIVLVWGSPSSLQPRRRSIHFHFRACPRKPEIGRYQKDARIVDWGACIVQTAPAPPFADSKPDRLARCGQSFTGCGHSPGFSGLPGLFFLWKLRPLGRPKPRPSPARPPWHVAASGIPSDQGNRSHEVLNMDRKVRVFSHGWAKTWSP